MLTFVSVAVANAAPQAVADGAAENDGPDLPDTAEPFAAGEVGKS
jgi:hypothetical protein